MMPKPPVVCFGARETRAVDSRLLTCAKANDGPMQGIGDAIGLSVFECKSSDDEVCYRGLGKL